MQVSHLFKIDDLTQPSTCLVPGHVYAAIVQNHAYAFALAWGALLDAAIHGRPTWLVTHDDPAGALSADSTLAREGSGALRDGLIHILQVKTVPSGVGNAAIEILKEFDYFRVAPGSLLVLDGAESYLNESALADNAVIDAWRHWAEHSGRTLLLLFRHDNAQASAFTEELIRKANYFAGIARLHPSSGNDSWEIFHWFGPGGYTAGRSLRLVIASNGALAAFDKRTREVLELAADEASVFAIKSALAGPPPQGWIVVDDLQALMPLALQAVAATVIIGFDRDSHFDAMARAIFTLRKSCGKQLKIIIREIDTHLRYSHEFLTLQLGASLVVPPEVNFSRFLSMQAMAQGQIFHRDLPDSYEEAAVLALPQQTMGYLAPRHFVQAVSVELDNAYSLAVQSVLIRLRLAFGLKPIDALRHVTVKRAGDIYSSDNESIYVFLFACREGDVDIALERLFRLPVEDLFEDEQRYLSSQTVLRAMQQFAKRANQGELPDLHVELAALHAQYNANSTPAERNSATRATKDSFTVARHRAPPSARRQPLQLRAAVGNERK